jgi:hypothetical protein
MQQSHIWSQARRAVARFSCRRVTSFLVVSRHWKTWMERYHVLDNAWYVAENFFVRDVPPLLVVSQTSELRPLIALHLAWALAGNW